MALPLLSRNPKNPSKTFEKIARRSIARRVSTDASSDNWEGVAAVEGEIGAEPPSILRKSTEMYRELVAEGVQMAETSSVQQRRPVACNWQARSIGPDIQITLLSYMLT
jgi:hypothetical protein